MDFSLPQALVLLVPLAWVARSPAWPAGPVRWVRFAALAVAVVALAQPHLAREGPGTDAVLLVDRSASMPRGADGEALELARLLEAQRRTGDRLAVIAFGRGARVESPFTATGTFGGFQTAIDAEASNLEAGLTAAEALLVEGRAARVLVLSDGRSTGVDPLGAARRLAARGVGIDVRHLGRPTTGLDTAVTAIDVAPRVDDGAPLLLPVAVHATAATRARVTVLRDGQPLASTDATLSAGDTVLTFRDRLETPGLHTYAARVDSDGDTVPENDTARAVVRVDGPPRVLVVTAAPSGALTQALRAARVTVETRAPGPLELGQLEGVGAVVLENVEAGTLGEATLHVLAHYVTIAGGGLLLTGGTHSFGAGGYRRSPVEDVLPVTLELRQEQRKAAIALSVVMDCSCSMGVTVPDGRTKMEVAAEGVVAALGLLTPHDEASVQLVDTNVHELFGLRSVSEGLPLNKVASAFSGGGGIYVGLGLRAAKQQILSSSKMTRHVLLFSDAADSEEPDDSFATLDALTRVGVTVSVIGLGKPTDSDAQLLRDIAARGKGRMYFAEDPMSLPRIFSQETIAVARASFVDSETPVRLGPDATQLGTIATAPFSVGGYNRVWLRPTASAALRTGDDDAAPIAAFWPHGRGRAAALTAEVDGPFTGGLRAWPGTRAMLEGLVRWLQPAASERPDLVVRAQRARDAVHVTLDVANGATLPSSASVLLLSGDGRSPPLERPLRPESDTRVGAMVVLPGSGTWHPVVQVDGHTVRAAPVTLPWAPEFEPAREGEGRAALLAVAEAGAGAERGSLVGFFEAAGTSRASTPLAPWLVVLCLTLLIADVWLRRFFSTARRSRPATSPAPLAAVEPVAAPAAAPGDPLAEARARARTRTERL
ncbi:MAG: VWA domain-containing protein [Archangium sp.]|nr:VWA domain-containing protein [Archangium sp.]